MQTVGELKEFIKDLPDDMPIAHYKRDMETDGYRNNLVCDVTHMNTEKKHGWDRFDGTSYEYDVLVEATSGTPHLRIL